MCVTRGAAQSFEHSLALEQEAIPPSPPRQRRRGMSSSLSSQGGRVQASFPPAIADAAARPVTQRGRHRRRRHGQRHRLCPGHQRRARLLVDSTPDRARRRRGPHRGAAATRASSAAPCHARRRATCATASRRPHETVPLQRMDHGHRGGDRGHGGEEEALGRSRIARRDDRTRSSPRTRPRCRSTELAARQCRIPSASSACISSIRPTSCRWWRS